MYLITHNVKSCKINAQCSEDMLGKRETRLDNVLFPRSEAKGTINRTMDGMGWE